MKSLLSYFLLALSMPVFAQMDVQTTRLTHLLSVPNQATFNHTLTIAAGGTVFIYGYRRDDYYQVRYNRHDYLVYYPYFDQIQFAVDLKEEALTRSKNGIKELPKQRASPSYTAPTRTIHTGPRGGRYYINKNGNKTYIKD